MQNEEKSKRKYHTKSLKDVKAEEDKDWTNCHEIEVKKDKWTLLPHELIRSLKMANRGSKRHARECYNTKLLRFFRILVIIAGIGLVMFHAICLSKNWDKTPEEMKWEEFCEGKETNSEACIKLGQSVTKTDNSN